MFHKTIQFVQVNVGENLAGQVAYGHSNKGSLSLSLSLSLRKAEDRFTDDSDGRRIENAPFNEPDENFLIHAVKELPDVRTPDERARIFPHEFLRPLNRPKQTFSTPARPCIVNKGFVEGRNEVVIKKPMDHAVAYTSNGNFPLFIVTDRESFIGTVAVSSARKITL